VAYFSRKRVPSWCDRVLYRSLPAGVGTVAGGVAGDEGDGEGEGVEAAGEGRIRVLKYSACHGLSTSDHAPVYTSCQVGGLRTSTTPTLNVLRASVHSFHPAGKSCSDPLKCLFSMQENPPQ
jgi:hypothetical protein